MYHPITAGFDFIGSHFVANFAANSTTATVDIPIAADLISDGTESFTVQLSLRTREIMSPSNNVVTYARIGSIPQATVYIQDEIILSFQGERLVATEGENLTLTVTASTASDVSFTTIVNISSADFSEQCKLKY